MTKGDKRHGFKKRWDDRGGDALGEGAKPNFVQSKHSIIKSYHKFNYLIIKSYHNFNYLIIKSYHNFNYLIIKSYHNFNYFITPTSTRASTTTRRSASSCTRRSCMSPYERLLSLCNRYIPYATFSAIPTPPMQSPYLHYQFGF